MDVALEERLLAARGEDAVHRLAGVRQAHREQEHLDLLVGQTDRHVPEVDLGFRPRQVGLRDERVQRSASRLDPYLRATISDIGSSRS
uniref:hypothetical protein n=1 Tax=Streptomyces violarus TaxID=67380 RepID=UPI00161129CB|nr:hypothetical protein [Streptomyces violarus]